MVCGLTEFISVSFSLAKNTVVEERGETIPFILSIKGLHSASPPIAFLLVIDTSYSMDGEKIFRAKQAALKILDILRDKDYVGVYSFSGRFNKVLEPTPLSDRGRIEQAIVSLTLGSGTNIYDVLKKLDEEVETLVKAKNIPVRIILLTDGQPTTGVKDPEKIVSMASKLSEKKVSSLIIGVGSDYNEKLLMRMASVLNGYFEHVDKPGGLEKVIYEYTATSKDISARDVTIAFRLKPSFRVIVYNRSYVNTPSGVVVRVGDISYREKIDIVGDIESPPLTRGLITIGDIQVSYTNPLTGASEFITPIPIEIESKPLSELTSARVSEEVIAKAKMVKTAAKIEELMEKGRGRDVVRELSELAEITLRVGSEELASKTINIKERVEREGLTPDLSKEIASIVSRIVSGKSREEKRGE